ncbi:MAG TPA: HAMP domain-containing protein, partial [Nitrospirae bacterium]|nr:HAMP domain-containing protein [Nitrospirota bacterium]
VIGTAESSENAGKQLKQALKKLDVIWNDTKDKITLDKIKEYKKRFGQKFKDFKKMAIKLQKAYSADDVDEVDMVHEEWLTIKPVIFKSIDEMGEVQKEAVKKYYTERQKLISKINGLIIITALFLITIFLFLGVTITRSITRPINDTTVMLKDIAEGKGDLTKRLTVTSKDEIGILAGWFNRFIEGMQNMVKGLLAVSREVSSTSNNIGRSSGLVHDSAKTQMQAIETTSASTEEMSSSIKAIANDTEELHKFIEDASSSSYEISAVISEIANNAEELNTLTDTTAASINQIAASIKQVDSGVATLFMETGDIASTMTEMSKSINEVGSYSKEQALMSGKARENASELGLDAVKSTRAGIERIKEEVFSTSEVVTKLGDMSKEIGKIIEVINGIADTTNLLSLNAAILAAQAGEHGKSFAVVADEVKGLADRTAFSTREIDELIKQVQENVAEAGRSSGRSLERVEEGLKLSNDAESALTRIVESSEASLVMAKKIDNAINEQTRGVEQVAQNIQRVNNMMDEIKRATGEQNNASGDILTATEKIRNFTQMVQKSTAEQSNEVNTLSKVVADASQRMKAITHATAEQRKAVENILKSIETIMEESEKNVNLSTELDGMVNNLETQGISLNKHIESFQI